MDNYQAAARHLSPQIGLRDRLETLSLVKVSEPILMKFYCGENLKICHSLQRYHCGEIVQGHGIQRCIENGETFDERGGVERKQIFSLLPSML